MRSARWILAPIVGYLAVLLAVAAFVVHPPLLGWIGFGVAAAIGLAIGTLAVVLYPHTRANSVRVHPREIGRYRLLVVDDAHCAAERLCGAVRDALRGRGADVLVVAPVLASALHFVTETEGREREDARARLAESLQGLARLGIQARGAVGADDPLQAIGDAVAAFAPNEILLVVADGDHRMWLERDLERQARDLFGVHVSTVTVAAAATVPA